MFIFLYTFLQTKIEFMVYLSCHKRSTTVHYEHKMLNKIEINLFLNTVFSWHGVYGFPARSSCISMTQKLQSLYRFVKINSKYKEDDFSDSNAVAFSLDVCVLKSISSMNLPHVKPRSFLYTSHPTGSQV